MNNFKKIGLSALAGSLVAVSAHAAEITMSGGASVAITSGDETGKSTYYQNDSKQAQAQLPSFLLQPFGQQQGWLQP